MSFFIKTSDLDLGETPIENIFITEFMPFSNGTYVKVYLLGCKYSKDINSSFNNKSIAKLLQIPISDVWEAWKHWEELNLIKRHFRNSDSDFDVEFISIKDMFIKDNYILKGHDKNPSLTKKTSDTSKLLQKQSNNDFMEICSFVESLLNIPQLSYSDRLKINDYMDNYYTDKTTLVFILEWAFTERGIKNVSQLKPLLQECINLDLDSFEDIKAHFETKNNRFVEYKTILSSLGLSYQNPKKIEKELIDKWIDDYKFHIDDLDRIISDLCKRTSSINLNYIDKVLSNLNEENISDFKTYIDNKNKRSENSSNTSTSNNFKHKKDNFSNFDSRSRRYSEDELEELLNINK